MSDPHIRLVTIVGPGGMGKTRLALAAAERQVSDTGLSFPHGIFIVPLAPLSSAGHFPTMIADALGLVLEGSLMNRPPAMQLVDYLKNRRLLLLLDNFEHVLEGAGLVSQLLQSGPGVQILVTSRERLQLQEEQVYPIQGLEFPDWETPEDAAEYTAVQLFVQSARRIQPDFTLGQSDLTPLTHICRLVEGMPLALELAAGWVEL